MPKTNISGKQILDASVDLTVDVTGTLPVANGGTGGTDAASARAALGAGTSNLAIGTTGTTAAAGNDSRLSDARTPTASSVTNASVSASAAIALSKLATGKALGSSNGTPADVTIWFGTTAQYNAIGTKDPGTVYLYT